MSNLVARCKHCGKRIALGEEKALSGEVQTVWADIADGEWTCSLNDGNEHEPGIPQPGTHIVIEGNPVDGFVFHGIPAFPDHDTATQWAENECTNEWWVAPLQDVEF